MFAEFKSKVIFIDFGLFMHRSIFGTKINPIPIPATYSCVRKILNCLKLIGVDQEDIIIVAMDGKGNWRKELDPNYKGNRREKRDNSGIDWYYWFGEFNKLVEVLKESTPFHYLRLDRIEADDIISVGCRYYADKECIIVSSDTDFHQLTAFPNVRIFSPITLKYKVIDEDPYKIIQKKIKKETTDNLTTEVVNELEYDIRYSLVNLLKLPDEIEKIILDNLYVIKYNDYDINSFPYDSLLNLFMSIYQKDQIETYEKAVKRLIRKKGQKNGRTKKVCVPKEIN